MRMVDLINQRDILLKDFRERNPKPDMIVDDDEDQLNSEKQ